MPAKRRSIVDLAIRSLVMFVTLVLNRERTKKRARGPLMFPGGVLGVEANTPLLICLYPPPIDSARGNRRGVAILRLWPAVYALRLCGDQSLVLRAEPLDNQAPSCRQL